MEIFHVEHPSTRLRQDHEEDQEHLLDIDGLIYGLFTDCHLLSEAVCSQFQVPQSIATHYITQKLNNVASKVKRQERKENEAPADT